LDKKKSTKKVVRQNADAADEPITVSARWLAGAFGVVLALAALCAYATLGLLFYQGQWQLMLRPSKTITAVPQAKYDEIHFDVTETGVPQLDGWWIPARMTADADAAWSYLTGMRNFGAANIVIYGTGAGASLAAELAARHAPAGMVMDGPSETARKIIGSDARARILPMWLLLTQRFDPAPVLSMIAAPKLFLDRNGAKARTQELYREAASPKEYFELKQDNEYASTLTRFFDGVLH